MQNRITFSGNPLNRSANERRDDSWVMEHLSAPGSRYLPFWRLNPLARGGEPAELRWLGPELMERLDEGMTPLLLGVREGVAHFAIDLSAMADPLVALGLEGGEFCDARGIATSLADGEAGILAQARSLIDWHTRHRFCGSCGRPTRTGSGGGMRSCSDCGAEDFPNPHPVVIMVVWRGDRCLLGQGRSWAQPRFSALAGFMDQGETIEEAVAREVKEEVGLEADDVVYVASQPWPFPANLMIGCFAHVNDDAITLDQVELANARWFSKDEIRRAFEAPESVDFGIPAGIAIAHHLIRAWIDRT
jgi:NAD+ diphosphatase